MRAGDLAEIRGERDSIRNIDVGAIQKVIDLSPELQVRTLAQPKFFLEREVKFRQTWSNDGIPRCIPKCERRRQRKDGVSNHWPGVLGPLLGFPVMLGRCAGPAPMLAWSLEMPMASSKRCGRVE
jgi:hypothetical protein